MSISNNRGEIEYKNLWDEIYGCNMYLKLSINEVMDMPVHIRKFWIDKFMENEKGKKQDNGQQRIDGANINTYAAIEQDNLNNRK